MISRGDESRANGSIWSFPYVMLMAVNLFQSMAAFMANTTLPVYADAMGASTSMVGVIVSSFTVSAILIRPFATPAFDSFSRKRLLIASQFVICLCLVLYGVADTIGQIIVIRLLHGVGIGCSGPLAMSLVSEFLPKDKFASGISVYTLAQSVAQVIGPAAGLYLGSRVGFEQTYFLAAAFLLVAIAGVALVREPSRERLPYRLRLNRMFARQALAKGLALMFLAVSFSCLTSYVVLYGYARGVQDIGLFFVVYAFCLVFTRPAFGKLADRFGPPRIILFGVCCFALSYVVLSGAQDMAGFLIAAVVGSAGFGCCAPLLQSMALASVPEDRRGAASSTAFAGLDLGMLAGPIVAGFLVDGLLPTVGDMAAAYSGMWLIMLIPAAGTFVIALCWSLRPSHST